MNETHNCPECGNPVPADSQHQLCPACLMAEAFASRTMDGENPPSTAPPEPKEIAGKFPQFEILECLGRGGMGLVYKARQKSLNRLVAIKILAPEREQDARFAERFAREAELLARLSHPHIVTIHDFGETGGLYFLVMEFVDGVNLRDLLRDGKLEPKQALAMVPPICEALQYAHDKGIVHRDIKPENLLLDRDGRIKIADFGIASLVGTGGESSGTPPYMAPEQANHSQIDHRADIYALGVVFYEMLTGERPGKDLVAPSRKVQLDVRIDEIVLRALEKEPEKRYQTAGEFRTVVETVACTESLDETRPISPTEPSRRGMLQRWWWMFLVMIPFGIVLGLVGGTFFYNLSPKKYESRTIFLIRPPEGGLSNTNSITPQFFGTEFERIKSTKNMAEVAKRLELRKRWKLREDQVVRTLKEIISTQNIRGTDLISIGVRYTNAQDAAKIAGTVAHVYREQSANRVIIHEEAQVPRVPLSPNSELVVVFGAGAGLLLSPLLALLSVAILQRRNPESQWVNWKETHPPDPEIRFYSRLSFGLFLAGTLGTLLLLTLSPRQDMACIFGAIAMLISLVLGGMSWREPLSKFVVITVCGVPFSALCMVLAYRMLDVAM